MEKTYSQGHLYHVGDPPMMLLTATRTLMSEQTLKLKRVLLNYREATSCWWSKDQAR